MEENESTDDSLNNEEAVNTVNCSGLRCGSVNNNDNEVEPSTSHVEMELENFRRQWKKELASSKTELKHEDHRRRKPRSRKVSENKSRANDTCSTTEEDSSVTEYTDESDMSNDESSYDDSSNEDGIITDLLDHFQNLLFKTGSWQLCYPVGSQKTTHISNVPTEVFLLILKWVVSKDLDIHSLEQLSKVCRGFFICCRDPEIWRLACLRIWGENCTMMNNYGSWREMFIHRPHLWYHGVYISKTTYIRCGEPSFQDASYRPCYVVEYFRYLRFFSDGQVLMLTTPDDPYQTIGKLRNDTSPHPSILKGRYQLVGSSIVAILKPPKNDNGNQNSALGNGLNQGVPWFRYQRQIPVINSEVKKKRFHMELEIKATKRRPSCKLLWRHYAVHSMTRSNQATVSNFDLTPSSFPPFWFSRVRSFTSESKLPLK